MKISTTILLLIVSVSAFSQTESTLYFMNSLQQSATQNPATLPRYKFSLGLPGSSTMLSYTNNGFNYNDLIKHENDSVKADFGKWFSSLAKKNYTTINVNTDLFRLGIRTKKNVYLMANLTVKGNGRFMFPKDLASIFVEGTGNYVGQTLHISPQAEGMGWIEAGLGTSIPVNEKLQVGGRIKYLKGMVSATTVRSDASLRIADDYAITAIADMSVRTSGIKQLTDGGNLKFSDFNGNSGFGLDVGATWQMLPKLQLSASLIDIGYIKWTNNLSQYQLDPEKARYTFKGLDLEKLLNGNDDYLDAELDSLEKYFKVEESTGVAYKTALPMKGFASATYAVSRNTSVGALLFVENYRKRFAPGLTTIVNNQLSKFVSITVSYTMSNRSYGNLGAGLSLNFAPIQLYIVGDNLLKIPFSLMANKNMNEYLNNAQVINFRAGLNIVWGWQKTKAETEKSLDKKPKRNGKNNAVKVRESK